MQMTYEGRMRARSGPLWSMIMEGHGAARVSINYTPVCGGSHEGRLFPKTEGKEKARRKGQRNSKGSLE